MQPDGNTAALRVHERVETENARLIEQYEDEAREALRARMLSCPATVQNGMCDFSEAEIHTRIRPLLDGRDDAKLGRLVRERTMRHIDSCFDDDDVADLAIRLGGGPVSAVMP